MNNAVDTVTAEEFLAAADAAAAIRYGWEIKLLAALLATGYVNATSSGYALLGGRTLELWQVSRFEEAGLMKRRIEYDTSIPQSMFDAPRTVDRYELTEHGRRVARIVGGRR